MSLRKPRMLGGMYLGNMPEEHAKMVLATRELPVVENLKHSIFDIPVEIIKVCLDQCVSPREYCQNSGIDISQFTGSLRDYQTVGTAFMYLSPRSILGDGVGLGKTAECAALVNVAKMKGQLSRFMMVVEPSAIGQTIYEMIRFTGLNVIYLPSETPKLRKTLQRTEWTNVDGCVMTHSGLRNDLLLKWLSLPGNIDSRNLSSVFSMFILDESSVIKNRDTKTAKYTVEICNIMRRVHFLNATTFETHIMDIYNQVDMMNPELLPSKSRIQSNCCVYSGREYYKKDSSGKAQRNVSYQISGYKNQNEFKESLKLVYFGRSKHAAGLDIPNVYKVFTVYPTPDQSLAIQKGYRYAEVLNCPSLIPEIGINTDKESVPKIERLINLLINEFQDSKVMIYCFHKEAQRAIAHEAEKIGRKPVIMNGESEEFERHRLQSEFNEGKADLFITNIKKSLNLFGGDVCILYSMETVPAKMDQILGRIDRNVDDSVKTFIALIYEGTQEYSYWIDTVRQRAQDAKDLTIDAKMSIDYFMEAMGIE